MELYQNDDMFAELCSKMYEYYRQRSSKLKERDAKREQEAGWYHRKDMLGMMLYIDNFAGNMQGVKEKIPYLKECNINCLHFMPFLDTPEGRSDGGYAVADFRKVRPDLGTMKDLAELAEKCHEEDINVCMDFVMNHTSEDHEWAKRARDYVMTTFYPYQWDLNYRNPRVFNEMMYNFLYLTNQGIDIVRIDAVPYIWKELGTTCRNLKQVHTIVRMMRMIAEIVCPSVLLLGEVVMEPEKVVPYFGTVEKPECHMLYNVTTMATTWNSIAARDIRLLKKQMDILNHLPKQYVFLNYLRCHDDIGWGLDYETLKQWGMEEIPHKRYLNDYFTGKIAGSISRGELYNDDPVTQDARFCGTTASMCGIEKAGFEQNKEAMETAVREDLMLHAYMLTQSGIPMLYSGDELGQVNDYSYKEDPAKCADSRYIHRGKLQWELAENKNDPTTVQGSIFQTLDRLEKIRRQEITFDKDADVYTYDVHDDSVLCILREYKGRRFFGIFNFSDQEKTAWMQEDGVYRNLLTSEKMELKDIRLRGYDFLWCEK